MTGGGLTGGSRRRRRAALPLACCKWPCRPRGGAGRGAEADKSANSKAPKAGRRPHDAQIVAGDPGPWPPSALSLCLAACRPAAQRAGQRAEWIGTSHNSTPGPAVWHMDGPGRLFEHRKSIFFTSPLPVFAHGPTARIFLLFRASQPETQSIQKHARQRLASCCYGTMSAMRKHNVTTFPRPPIVERTNRHIQIKWHGQLLADCPPGEAYWVLEAHHAPGRSPLPRQPISHPSG
jgi:hypothetical protein